MGIAYVIGLGKSGVAASRLLVAEGWQVVLSDRSESPALEQQQRALAQESIAVRLGHSLDLAVDRPDRLVISPGVPWDLPVLGAARDQGIEMMGEMELAWRSLQALPWLAITGTNGKTTTTALVAAIWKAAGLAAPACGNIGNAAAGLALAVREGQPLDWAIAEVSSYQCESSDSLAPQIGIWTTFTPDHLARHHSLENYYNIKASLLRRSRQQILNGDDAYLADRLGDWPDAYWTTTRGPDALAVPSDRLFYLREGQIEYQGQPIADGRPLAMVGDHNQQNLLLAVAAAHLAGIGRGAIDAAIASFPGVAHRLEKICRHANVDYINDSKATNYDAADVGLSAVAAPVILIAGGEAKEGDDRAWLARIQAKAAAVLLIGNAAPAFEARLRSVGYGVGYGAGYGGLIETPGTLAAALPRAAELADELAAQVVLFSPACASFDQYANFEQRGDDFRAQCLKLTIDP
jgi:UDP-N-acetylmuramoylalanine--D-glutamate ligase